ncbi:MAG TPA: energy transducer TonB, partial [Rhodanobacter sp.]
MLRLRTTTGLSMFALAIGIVGTGWLSTLTGDWRGPPLRHAGTHRITTSAVRPALSASRHRHRPVGVVQAHRAETGGSGGIAEAQAASP